MGCILLILPIPLFFLIRWRKRKNREGREIAAAEAEALRQRTQSKFMRPGSKSFTLRSGPSADIMVGAVLPLCACACVCVCICLPV